MLKINVDKHGELTQQHGIRGIPAFLIYDEKGKLVAEGEGAREWVMERLDK